MLPESSGKHPQMLKSNAQVFEDKGDRWHKAQEPLLFRKLQQGVFWSESILSYGFVKIVGCGRTQESREEGWGKCAA